MGKIFCIGMIRARFIPAECLDPRLVASQSHSMTIDSFIVKNVVNYMGLIDQDVEFQKKAKQGEDIKHKGSHSKIQLG